MHMRTLHRMISKEAVLYTEMITTNTLVRTMDPERYLESNFAIEEPLVLQLGGSCPTDMRTASAMAKKIGFQEININAGCPSEKVSGGLFFYSTLVFVYYKAFMRYSTSLLSLYLIFIHYYVILLFYLLILYDKKGGSICFIQIITSRYFIYYNLLTQSPLL